MHGIATFATLRISVGVLDVLCCPLVEEVHAGAHTCIVTRMSGHLTQDILHTVMEAHGSTSNVDM